jgi:hypothetical protein
MPEDNNNEEFDGPTFPLPDDLTFKTLVEASIELADKIGDILHGQEQVLAICSLVLVMKKGLTQAQSQMVELVSSASENDMKAITEIIGQAIVAEKSLGNFLAVYPSLRIGKGYKEQVDEYFNDDDDQEDKEDKLEIPTPDQMEDLFDRLFTPEKGDDE